MTQADRTGSTNLFTGDDDLYTTHPEIAHMLDSAAHELERAHRANSPEDVFACLARAEQHALAANGAFAVQLGGVDPALLVPLVRLAVDALAHREVRIP